MMLALDARNLVLTVGFRDDSTGQGEKGRWLEVRRFGALPGRTADEYAFFLTSAWREACTRADGDWAPAGASGTAGAALAGRSAEQRGGAPRACRTPESAWISSVVPALTPQLAEAVRESFGIEAKVLGPGVKTGVKIRTDFPSEVGSDLICEAAAAHELCAGPCLIVDYGAVLTVSAVNALGEFLGVAIAPGLRTAADSLKRIAAQLPEVRLDPPAHAIGKSTAQSVQSGVVIGYQSLVRGLIERMGAELMAASPSALDREAARQTRGIVPDCAAAGRTGEAVGCSEPALIGTGESAGAAFLASCGIRRFEPELVLEGLAAIAEKSRAAAER